MTTNPIHIKRMIVVMVLMFCLLTVPGCSSSGKTAEDNNLYTEIMTSENLPIDKAYEKLKNNSSANSEQTEFIQRLKDLNDCSGKFANTTERGNVYSADVSFYLSGGKVYSIVTYSGYMGEIGVGEVRDSNEEGYLFESEPKGDLYGNEQDFHLCFGKDKLHIMWAENCDYVLDRGDGSAESVEDYKTPFEESETFKKKRSL